MSNHRHMEPIQVSLDVLQRSGLGLDDYLEYVGSLLIEAALKQTGDNKQQAALIIGLNRTTMLWRMGRFSILKRRIHPASGKRVVN